jgi:DNA-nicking Smr family endonuclease
MKHSKKKTAKKAAQARSDSAPPEKLYRPFEKLAKAEKLARSKKPQAAGTPDSGRARQAAQGAQKGNAHKPNSGQQPRGAPAAERAMAPSDAESFAIYMAGVRELEDRATRIPRSASRIERAARGALPAVDADAPARAQLQALVAEGIRFETSDDGERIEGRRIEVEPREVRRLRRGQYTVDQQVDLHGLNVPEARKAIEAFVEKRRKEGDRVVRIIHGKGGHSPRGVSALRGEIAAWLSQGPAKRHVAAFATAPPEEGGAGALLVLLMRRQGSP